MTPDKTSPDKPALHAFTVDPAILRSLIDHQATTPTSILEAMRRTEQDSSVEFFLDFNLENRKP